MFKRQLLNVFDTANHYILRKEWEMAYQEKLQSETTASQPSQKVEERVHVITKMIIKRYHKQLA